MVGGASGGALRALDPDGVLEHGGEIIDAAMAAWR